MSQPAQAHDAGGKLGFTLAFAFGCVFIMIVLVLAFASGGQNDQLTEMLRIVLALAGGGVGAVIPGFLDLRMKAGTKWAVHAGGGLAVFIVLYFWSPAHWGGVAPGSVNQETHGPNSPAINGNGNVVKGEPAR
jgi:hypothetical protein